MRFHVAPSRRQPLELRRDFAVVTRRARIGLPRQLQPRRQAQLALLAQFRGHRRVIRRIGHHPHALEIFRRRAHHRRPADIDIFDQFLRRHAGLRRRRRKRIQIHHHQIDRHDPVLAPPACDPPPSRAETKFRRALSDAASSRARPAFPASRSAPPRRAPPRRASRSNRAVPPVETISTPSDASSRANSTTPVLSNTLTSARAIPLSGPRSTPRSPATIIPPVKKAPPVYAFAEKFGRAWIR